MKWPWVSRRAFDLVMADRDFWRDALVNERIIPNATSRPPAANAPSEPTQAGSMGSYAAVPDASGVTWNDVGFAIAARAGSNGPLRAHLAAFAQQRKLGGDANDEILRRVTDWSYKGSEESPTKDRDREDAEAEVVRLLDADE